MPDKKIFDDIEGYLRFQRRRAEVGTGKRPLEHYTQEDVYAHLLRNMREEDDSGSLHDVHEAIVRIIRKEGDFCDRFHRSTHEIAKAVYRAITRYKQTGDQTYKDMAESLLTLGVALADHHEMYHTFVGYVFADEDD